MPTITNVASIGIFSHVTVLRLPNVQVMNNFRESGSAKLCKIVIAALVTYPKIIPNTRMVTESLMRDDTKRIKNNTRTAPAMATITCAMLPIASISGYADVPAISVSRATPNPAPELTPSTSGPASAFLNNVCINKPAADRDAPARSAVIALGRR